MTIDHDVLRGMLATLLGGLLVVSIGCGGDDDDGDGNGNGNGDGNGQPPATCDSPQQLTTLDVLGGTTLDGCYRALGVVTIANGTLEMEPGTTILFPQDTGLDVQGSGRLRADGTADNPVRLIGTEDSRGHWRGVRYRETRSQDNLLTHTTIAHAGGRRWTGSPNSQGCVLVEGTTRTVFDQVELRQCEQAGMVVDSNEAEVDLRNSTVTNSDSPLWMTAQPLSLLRPDNTYEDNDDNRIHLISNGQITEDISWPNPEIPIFVTVPMRITDAELTIAPGTTLQFDNDIGLDVSNAGVLNAVGGENQPITFTGARQERGYWKGLRFTGSTSSQNRLENAVVAHAGSSRWHGGDQSQAGLYTQGETATLTVANSRFRNNQAAGVSIDNDGAEVELQGNTFANNELPVRIAPNVVRLMSADNTFNDNDNGYVLVQRGTVEDAGTWANVGVPYRADDLVRVADQMVVAPGTTLEFDQDAGIDVGSEGQLSADASDGPTITFRGAEQLQGFWLGIRFTGSFSVDNTMNNVVLAHGGARRWHGGEQSQANVYLQGRSLLTLDNATIRQSGFHGLSADGQSRVDGCQELTFQNNAGSPVVIAGSATAAEGCEVMVDPEG